MATRFSVVSMSPMERHCVHYEAFISVLLPCTCHHGSVTMQQRDARGWVEEYAQGEGDFQHKTGWNQDRDSKAKVLYLRAAAPGTKECSQG